VNEITFQINKYISKREDLSSVSPCFFVEQIKLSVCDTELKLLCSNYFIISYDMFKTKHKKMLKITINFCNVLTINTITWLLCAPQFYPRHAEINIGSYHKLVLSQYTQPRNKCTYSIWGTLHPMYIRIFRSFRRTQHRSLLCN
jgi:hypothetical protein